MKIKYFSYPEWSIGFQWPMQFGIFEDYYDGWHKVWHLGFIWIETGKLMKPYQYFKKLGACKEGVDFARKYETLREVYENCNREDWLDWWMGAIGFEMSASQRQAYNAAKQPAWEAYKAITQPVLQAYNAAKQTAREAYKAIEQPALEAYKAIAQPAWEAYNAIEQPALEAYNAAKQPAWEAYEAITQPAWEAYSKKRCEAFRQLVKFEDLGV
jgi:tryptophan-rich sensory protein